MEFQPAKLCVNASDLPTASDLSFGAECVMSQIRVMDTRYTELIKKGAEVELSEDEQDEGQQLKREMASAQTAMHFLENLAKLILSTPDLTTPIPQDELIDRAVEEQF